MSRSREAAARLSNGSGTRTEDGSPMSWTSIMCLARATTRSGRIRFLPWVDLPVALIDGERARRIVDAVEQRLLTPIGLRSLAPGEPGYAPRYEGDSSARDAVYHQGTVWPWLMGPFVEAWVRVRGNTSAGATRGPHAIRRSAARASAVGRPRARLGNRRCRGAVRAKGLSVPGVVAWRTAAPRPRGSCGAEGIRKIASSREARRRLIGT